MSTRQTLLAVMLILLMLAGIAQADTYQELNASGISVSSNITVNVPGENAILKGINPITGEEWNGQYFPVAVSIDNHPDSLPHWGVSQADLLYEIPSRLNGYTRILAIFMGNTPNYAGPIRESDMNMANLREIWDGALVFYGMGTSLNPNDDVKDYMIKLQPDARQKNDWVFPYIDLIGKNYRRVIPFQKDERHKSPHNIGFDVEAVVSLFTSEPAMHPFIFTSEGLDYGDDVSEIRIDFGPITSPMHSVTQFEYDETIGKYLRYANGLLYTDDDNGDVCKFSNVIIVRTEISSSTDKKASSLNAVNYGQGTCEIFQNGKYIRGTWVRTNDPVNADETESASCRMIFLDDKGAEFQMKIGKTAICYVDLNQPVVVLTNANLGKTVETPAPTATPEPTATP